MWITSERAAKLCGVSSSWFQRFVKKALEARPTRVGNRSSLWGARTVLGAMLVPALERLGASPESALMCGQAVANDYPTDEAAEASLFVGGRCFLMLSGQNASPFLHTAAEVQELDRDIGPGLKRLGLGLRALDLRELWNDIASAAVAEEARSEYAAE